jgi:hypothetical protein
MCFSATASFGAGVVLSVIGVATIKKVIHPSQIPFATIPLLFSMQQFSEGFLWLALTQPAYAFLQEFTTYLFLTFAQVIWPFYVPAAIFLFQEKEKRGNISKILAVIGAAVSLYLAYCLLMYPVEAKITGHHIAYWQDYPDALDIYSGTFYVLATIVPAFFSPIKHMRFLGAAILISYIITQVFYSGYIVSVWCFFASIISIIVFIIMATFKNTDHELLRYTLKNESWLK